MIRASSLSGDTLIACHFPVQLPTTTTWQLHPIQVGRCGSSASNNKPGRLCAAGRAVSLPEQGSLHRLEPFTASSGIWRRNVSSSHGSLKEDRVVEEEGAGSDSSGRDDSASSPEEVASAPPATNVIGAHRARKEGGGGGTRACLRSRNNSFLPCSELDEDEDEDSEGDNLHRYREDSSFVLHGNSNWALVSNNASGHSRTPRAGDMEGVLWWGKEVGTLLEADMRDGGWLSNRTGLPDITFPSCQCFLVRRSRAILTDRGEQEWPRLNETRKSCVDNGLQHRCCVSEMSNGHVAAESVSDSSSNSSDGVLVNFCAIYDKSSDPSVPRDLLGSPAMEPSSPSPVAADGSVFLNLRPVSQQQTPNADVQQTGDCWTVSAARLEAEVDIMMGASAACQSPRRGLDTNCNLYPVPGPPLSQVLTSSLEVSDLNACLQSQATLATGTNQKYYKLVTCEPPSQSPSPAWSSLFVPSCADGQRRRASPDPLPSQCLSSGQRKDAQQKDKVKEKDEQRIKESPKTSSSSAAAARSSTTVFDYARCDASKTQFTSPGSIHSYSHTAVSVCSQSNAENILGQGPGSIVAAQPSFVTLDQAHCEDEAEAHGTCPSAAPVVRYTKAQRPTSLPIQPCVLLTPPGQPQQAQQLGSLLDQYMSQRATGKHSSSSQPGCNKGKGEGSGISTYLQPSPLMGNHGQPFLLEAPSSSDTCSTCASSPECSSHWNTWSEYASTDQGQSSLCGSQISLTYSSSPKPKVGQAPACQDDASARSGATRRDDVLKSLSFKPSQTSTSKAPSAPNQPERLVTVATCRDLVNLVPEEEETPHASTEPKHHTSPTHIRSSSYHAALSQSPSPAASPMSRVPALLVSPCPPVTPQPRRESPRCPSAAQTHLFQDKLAASLSPASLRSPAVAGSSGPQQPQQRQDLSGPGGTTADQRQCQQHRSESLILSDRPPVEFCLSPDASYDSLSLSHLQRRGLLRSVSMAVDLIMAHFGSSRDPEDKMRLGNSSWSPTIAGLVLEHLCPTVQNILEDGLRDHKLDVIIGQRRNHTWSVVEVSTQTGSCARVLNSLVSKINQCSQLADYSIRLRAFIMGLLNLRALEYWLCHLQSQKDVVTTHYHSWGFLAMSQGQSQPLFQELLLLLQPLSMLPFDLNLLLEPRLLHSRQLCSEEYGVPPPCSTLLMTSWPLLQADKKAGASSESSTRTTGSPRRVQRPQASSQKPPRWCQYRPQVEENRAVPDGHRWPARTSPAFVDGVVEEGEDCCRRDSADDTRVPSFRFGKDDERRERGDSEGETVGTPSGAEVRDESPSQGGLRWAKLFGAAMDPASTTTRTNRATSGNVSGTQQPRRRPSEWLQLNRSQLGLLAQSVCSVMELITWTETSRTTRHQPETFPDRR